ncbi:hypothetical protein B0H13DRAFT_2328773 [Mycena leptocephala]|nr:hypothetical protein B0H13DRAFT_2328773 [Mycena leptocephala]
MHGVRYTLPRATDMLTSAYSACDSDARPSCFLVLPVARPRTSMEASPLADIALGPRCLPELRLHLGPHSPQSRLRSLPLQSQFSSVWPKLGMKLDPVAPLILLALGQAAASRSYVFLTLTYVYILASAPLHTFPSPLTTYTTLRFITNAPIRTSRHRYPFRVLNVTDFAISFAFAHICPRPYESTTSTLIDLLKGLVHALDPRIARTSPHVSQPARRPFTCSYCSGPTHLLRQCPHIASDVRAGICQRNAQGKVVISSGLFVPHRIHGPNLRAQQLCCAEAAPDAASDSIRIAALERQLASLRERFPQSPIPASVDSIVPAADISSTLPFVRGYTVAHVHQLIAHCTQTAFYDGPETPRIINTQRAA